MDILTYERLNRRRPETVSVQLPEAYMERIKRQLGGEADEFLRSYGEPRTHGLRLNPLKLGIENPTASTIREMFGLTPVPWCPTGYYIDEEARPGKHPYHQAGLYYMQEPSAMAPAELLAPVPGEFVLDLAAAPGGKTTQLLGKLQGEGLLVSNEIHPARAKILSENVERIGAANAIVVSASPDELAERFPQAFDAIMLDAPCSGEGMFRKDPDATLEWSPAHVDMCAARQEDIAMAAIRMLKPGGRLVYSTCTFNEEENERLVARLLALEPALELERTERLWPHRVRGEGHFAALLRLRGSSAGPEAGPGEARIAPASGKRARRGGTGPAGAPRLREAAERWDAFRSEALPGFATGAGEPLLFGEQLYWLPHAPGGALRSEHLAGLKVLRPGLHLGALRAGRFEPAHALALALPRGAAARECRLPAESPEAAAYLRGEALAQPELAAGWTVVTVDGYPLGWGKVSGGQLKNHYPKGLRRHS
ncbi:RsmB/NOP family class I SAM-dependent RNA methyltransferase [Paenibacillus chartarius]|uniref:RsmB/NOP family class I SAM-dependent RNA methyltransferase n=1 Tax=Paenibacillus chartarius TaxID=747481 RepID=A0ABV6DEQ3_9BACL